MKKLYLLLAIALITVTAQAQLIVDSLGRAAFATTTNNSYQINVLGTNSGINCTSGTGTPLGTTAINATAYQKNYFEAIAVKGTVYTGSTGDAFSVGVYGLASTQNAGKNIGLYGGVIPHCNGTGLYASSSSYNGFHALSSRYAGYFDGDTRVDGSFSVNGVIISPSSSPSSSSTSLRLNDDTGQSITGQLSQLEPTVYYMETKRTTDAPIVKIEGDSSEGGSALPTEIPFTLLERQTMSKQHYGLDAEQLEEIFPDLVYANEDGTKSINYVEMVPVLVQAIKELSAKVEALEGGKAVKKAKEATGINTAESVKVLSLGQNKPNPFSTATDIEVSVPENVQTAFLYIYDLQGKKVQQVDITARGKQTIKVDAANLAEGMYLYSLIADGKVVETRRMIVEK